MKLKHESIFFDAFYSQGFQDWPTAKPYAVEQSPKNVPK